MFAFCRRLVCFVAVLAAVYFSLILLVANGTETTKAFVQRYTNIPAAVPVHADTPRRLAEVFEASDLDVLFIGSSHCYRAFDPRLFAAHGFRSFNLGSTAQTPLNSYFLLRQHLAHLKPKLVIVETYWAMFENDGSESFVDLLTGTGLNRDMLEMAWSTHSPLAWNALFLRALNVRSRSGTAFPPMRDEDMYVGRGFVERKEGFSGDLPMLTARAVRPNSLQFEYLRKMLQLVRSSGARVFILVQPMPRATVDTFVNRSQINRDITAIANAENSEFLDFNDQETFDGPEYFYDRDHLTQAGVVLFDQRLLEELEARELLPPRTAPKSGG